MACLMKETAALSHNGDNCCLLSFFASRICARAASFRASGVAGSGRFVLPFWWSDTDCDFPYDGADRPAGGTLAS
jgi:hypothetical protein